MSLEAIEAQEIHHLLLRSIHQLRGERGRTALFNVLFGQLNHQTIWDVYRYKVIPLFGLLHGESADKILARFNDCRCKGWIKQQSSGTRETLSLSDEGMDKLLQLNQTTLSQWIMDESRIPFNWNEAPLLSRLLLLVQTCSHLLYGSHSFQPITRDLSTQDDVKRLLLNTGILKISYELFSELEKLLELIPEAGRRVLLMRMTGFSRTGLTASQLAGELNQPVFIVRRMLHYSTFKLYYEAECNPQEYRVMKQLRLLADAAYDQVSGQLTASALETNKWICKGYSLDRIATIRKLKLNTIQDHVIELVLAGKQRDPFRWVKKSLWDDIYPEIVESSDKPIRVLKETLNSEIDYFTIRMVQAFHMKGSEGVLI